MQFVQRCPVELKVRFAYRNVRRGGVVGIVLGAGTTIAAGIIIPKVAPDFGTPTVSFVAIAVAIGVSLIIGLVAGGYPALRAARLQPIEALRFQ